LFNFVTQSRAAVSSAAEGGSRTFDLSRSTPDVNVYNFIAPALNGEPLTTHRMID